MHGFESAQRPKFFFLFFLIIIINYFYNYVLAPRLLLTTCTCMEMGATKAKKESKIKKDKQEAAEEGEIEQEDCPNTDVVGKLSS